MRYARASTRLACALALGLSSAHAFEPDRREEGVCALDDPESGGMAWQNSVADSVDPGCLVAATELLSADARTILVDVRPQRQIARAWVPGAVGIPAVLVGRDPLVKASASAVLMGNGRDTRRLLRLCTTLRADGLRQVRVLDGGVPGWHRAGGRVTGDTASLEAPLQLDDGELHEMLRHREAALLLAGVDAGDAIEASAVRIVERQAVSVSPKAVLKRLDGRLGSSAIVVMLPSIGGAAAWRDAAISAGMTEPLFYIGDGSRYDKFVKRLASIEEGASRRRDAGCESN